jgi:3-hydroxyisobutyrate dehydrogenase
MRTIAFIGAGQMGGRVARLLMRSGYELMICDSSPVVRGEFSAEGVATPRTPDC